MVEETAVVMVEETAAMEPHDRSAWCCDAVCATVRGRLVAAATSVDLVPRPSTLVRVISEIKGLEI